MLDNIDIPTLAIIAFGAAALFYMLREKKKKDTSRQPAKSDEGVWVPYGWNVFYLEKADPMDEKMGETIESLGLKGQLHTLELAKSLAEAVLPESEYASDVGLFDDWSFVGKDVVHAIKTHEQIMIRDDCDWQRALLWVLKELGWKKEWLAECIVHSPQPSDNENTIKGNHYIGAFYVPGDTWYGFNCWNYGKVFPLTTYRDGGFVGHMPWTLTGVEFISHCLVGEAYWRKGSPGKSAEGTPK